MGREDAHYRFDDLFNLVADPSVLLVAWDRVRGNKGAPTAGVDGQTAYYVEAEVGVEVFLDGLRPSSRTQLPPASHTGTDDPNPCTTKRRRLGISAVRDRVAQASLKLVLKPIFEAGLGDHDRPHPALLDGRAEHELRTALAHRPDPAAVGAPRAAVQTAGAFLGAGYLEDAYLALRGAKDVLDPRAAAAWPTTGAPDCPAARLTGGGAARARGVAAVSGPHGRAAPEDRGVLAAAPDDHGVVGRRHRM